MSKYKITFLPDQKEVEVESGVTLLEAAEKAGIYINSICGGEGLCVLSISEMGHFLNRTLWHNQVALASSLRSRLYSLRRLIVCICTSFLRCRILYLLSYKTSAGVTLPSAL